MKQRLNPNLVEMTAYHLFSKITHKSYTFIFLENVFFSVQPCQFLDSFDPVIS